MQKRFSAKMAVRAALTGHLVFTTLHSGTVEEAIRRMLEFGVDPKDLSTILQAVFAQRLYKSKKDMKKIWERNAFMKDGNGKTLKTILNQEIHLKDLIPFEEIEFASASGWIEAPKFV